MALPMGMISDTPSQSGLTDIVGGRIKIVGRYENIVGRHKKNDVAGYPMALDRVGLRFNKPPARPSCSLSRHPLNLAVILLLGEGKSTRPYEELPSKEFQR